MTTITGTAQRTAWLEHSMPEPERVSEHVWSVPVACDPFPVRYTLAYLLANDAGEFVVVDPGWDSAHSREQLFAGIRAAGLTLGSLIGIVVTHFHPDHIGMAQELADLSGAWVAMHPLDSRAGAGDASTETIAAAIAADSAWLAECGVPAIRVPELKLTAGSFRAFGQNVAVGIALADGDRLPLEQRDIRVSWTPGHSAGHICLIDHDDRLVLTGDHVLPRISPNIGLGFHDGDRDSVGEYLRSLETISEWDAYEVCPAHEWRFTGLAERCAELAGHHAERAAEVQAVLDASPTASVWQIAERLTWSRGWANLDAFGTRGALGETLAHLRHLSATGTLRA